MATLPEATVAPRRILFVSQACYFDDSTGASVASRSMLEALARHGFAVEAVSGTQFVHGRSREFTTWLETNGIAFQTQGQGTNLDPTCYVTDVRGVTVTIHRGLEGGSSEDRAANIDAFFRRYELTLDRFRPDVVVVYGNNAQAQTYRKAAASRGCLTVIPIHIFNYTRMRNFLDLDAAFVPSRFAAEYYRRAMGIHCEVITNPVDWGRCRAERHEPRYLTFVNPSNEKGVYVFAQIAEQLLRRRPEIPIQIVESRGTLDHLRKCVTDFPVADQVRVVAHTRDPRQFWGETRVCILPSLWWENQPLVAIEAMINGIPVVGSDRGGIPETLGQSGVVLPIPGRITDATRVLPTAEEVAPWVDAITRFWDDPAYEAMMRDRSLAEAQRWAPEVVESQYVRYFQGLDRAQPLFMTDHPERRRSVVVVAHQHPIAAECEASLQRMERSGVRVVRRAMSSRVDEARSILASEALRVGAESILLLDPDISFSSIDALRILARPEPVICGIAPQVGRDEPEGRFAREVTEVIFGTWDHCLFPLDQVAPAFLRIQVDVLRQLRDQLDLTLWVADEGQEFWPFFMPLLAPETSDRWRYLNGDRAFDYRLGLIGVTPLADTSLQLRRWGLRPRDWEAFGAGIIRPKKIAYYPRHGPP